ncbi:hypothetical protein A2526_02010 [candidate division WOR-1 bacterium RIFOXYD2_FULL_36_8]|uniref:Uncharacterized protein n=1 Tax=candidate division WOR-1 bacterium RIFOXYB2_FULL_36_35 TaxID=1802578 RepID=A0A1F4S189_UNCSA|nr:MAG: hypothetical protein A2230_03425 [candidate division WOR-1 bacterium RIFOXYA2_FULL_36_21]OGC14149.1 MAG: hypothetical protein A2290_00535 [candidate division WOR-1 bacterium RIFOXYB2_FULL_36_35]OGC15371.1 MAG: hypothetical protein A2282_01525 [candidate division WOR-1 bacterium RIFOXYA12_FULL_36_13]OGC38637.1 MAG: hypothetical protein A2526_02010 [candidate division WOR-1 bacterium RIFOXYD2_FULL_36_8]
MIKFLRSLFARGKNPSIIEIDDSGSGSLYGGIMILLNDGENISYGEVSLKTFRIKDKKKRSAVVQKEIFKIIKKGLKNLSASPQKTILKICQGSLFNFSEKELEKKKFTVQRVQIRGETNDKAENLFHKILKDKFNITTKDPKDYKGENLRQFAILKKRRDFKNVKRFVNGVEKIIQSSP